MPLGGLLGERIEKSMALYGSQPKISKNSVIPNHQSNRNRAQAGTKPGSRESSGSRFKLVRGKSPRRDDHVSNAVADSMIIGRNAMLANDQSLPTIADRSVNFSTQQPSVIPTKVSRKNRGA